MARSFESVDFSVRKNKNIQRKLICELLRALQGEFEIGSYDYIGMGSLWFVDFLLFHRHFGLRNMISIQEPDGFDRARFNLPLSCITVKRGLTTRVLPTLDLRRRAILWLDYDEHLQSSVCSDMENVLKRVIPGSLGFITVRAELKDFGGPGATDQAVKTGLRQELGSWLPRSLPEAIFSADTFASAIANLLHSMAGDLCATRFDSLRWVPILSYEYSDNTRMATIGGMVCDRASATKLASLNILGGRFYKAERIVRIAAPQLTPREKASVDAMLPADLVKLRKTKLARGLKGLAQEYAKYYLYYPVFWELNP